MNTESNSLSLKERIAEFTKGTLDKAPAELRATLSSELRKLAESGIAKNALQVGAKAPDFRLPEARGGIQSLSSLLSEGPVIVTFYRGGWCPFCNLQLRAYQSVLPEIRRLGGQLVAISPQTPDNSLSDVEKKELTFPVLSDLHNIVARQYGLVFELSDVLKELQKGWGNPLPKYNGDDSWELPVPGTFVLDRNGVVRLAHVDPDYMRRLEPSIMLDALREVSRLESPK
jgi:peroxiredoxin